MISRKVINTPPNCCLCGNFLKNKRGFVIKGKSGKSLAICSDCLGEVYQAGIRFTVDVMIVPVKEDSLKLVLFEKIYICPDRYITKNPKMIAFYIGGKVGAITHLARVQSIEKNVPKENTLISNKLTKPAKWKVVPRWKTFNRYQVFHLQNVIELEKHIKRGTSKGGVIQQRIYTTFCRFLAANTISDLFQES